MPNPPKTCTRCQSTIAWLELLYLVEVDGKDTFVCAKCANAMKDVVKWVDVGDKSHGGSMRKAMIAK